MPPPFLMTYVDEVGTDILIHSIKSAHCLVIDSNYVWLIDFYSSNSFFDEAFCFSCWFFSNTVDAAVTALLSFHKIKVTLNFLSFTISRVPLDLFFISLRDINGKFSVRFNLTVPVAAIPLGFNNRKRWDLRRSCP